ncbi:S8 family serine peptidase [Lysobacter enzymogenes]|uniref:S8 family serine peptidase n=1 Tax=Lysobacter enzymogenes TaxID=69 RepID=UPI00384C33D4
MKLSSCRTHALAAATLFALTAAAPAVAGRVYLDDLKPDGRYSRFIVGYHVGSAPTQAPQTLRASLDAAAGRAALPDALRQRLGLKAVRAMQLSGARVVATDVALDRAQTETLMRQIAADQDVAFVQVDGGVRSLAVPNDPDFKKQWHYADSAVGIRAPTAWNTSIGSGVVVAVIDSGILSHTDLNANVIGGYDFISRAAGGSAQECQALGLNAGCGSPQDGDGRDSNPNDDSFATTSQHGTHVAGTIAAVAGNGQGGAGVAYGAKVVPIRALGRDGYGIDSDVLDAVLWAANVPVAGVGPNPNPADVINLSLGDNTPCSQSPAWQAAIDAVLAKGVTVIAAAGNSNIDVAGSLPASCNGVVSVAASNKSGNKSSYSSWGASIDVTAPGGENGFAGPSASDGIISTVKNNAYGPLAGTSMASPHVAGIAALVIAASPVRPTSAQIERTLKKTARPMTSRQCAKGCGAGIVDAAAAVAAAVQGNP